MACEAYLQPRPGLALELHRNTVFFVVCLNAGRKRTSLSLHSLPYAYDPHFQPFLIFH